MVALSSCTTDTAFKQQRLKAWQPILTPKTVLPTFFLIGIIFVPLGGVLLWGSNKVSQRSANVRNPPQAVLTELCHCCVQVKEFTIDYTQCQFVAPTSSFEPLPSDKYSYSGISGSIDPPTWQFTTDAGNADPARRQLCRLQFSVPEDLDSSVFMYYKRRFQATTDPLPPKCIAITLTTN